MSFALANEIMLYVVAATAGWLLSIVLTKIEDEDNSCNSVEPVLNSLHTKHNEVTEMNRRKLDNLDVESQQREMSKSFTAFKVVIAVLALCGAVCLVFAVHYSL